MALNLKPLQLELIHHMIQSNSLTTSQMAYAADCSKQSIVHIRSNLQAFGNVRAPRNGVGRPKSITPPMLEALCAHLKEKPGQGDFENDCMVDLFHTHRMRAIPRIVHDSP